MSGLIDLSLLPAPDVVETLDYETLYAERKAMFIALFPVEQRDAITRTLALESEPLTKLLQLSVYHELLLRQRVNEAASANMLAYAAGSDLDQLAANVNVQRLVITAEDTTAIPPIEAVMESDADLRTRTQQAFEGLSVAGPTAAYEFHARSADGRVADASAVSPSPAAVTVTVLSREGNGSTSDELLQAVDAALNAENVRPVADRVTVQSAVIIPYEIAATLYVYPGPEAEPIRIAAEARLQTYITAQHRLGRDIRRSAIFAALHVEGVQRVDLESPAADIVLDKSQASYCANWVLNIGGSDE
ncbi:MULTISPECIES: baseplate assembly protein [Pectobacterium]|uniref:Baseplate J family protein n=1 Tax=Pectobacterium carotovorum subsp. carotovorum (strain PC1) TaxID=561230 RepID=C6D9F7_PECCP|nr:MULTISPECIES: baseplate assembly protein [Pectobacterium]ACT13684.1 Baseplate J family protein [Pectobacterium carotovorum subsp. carotovorum PC1]KHT18091.1 baseplate assembly protein [Pectobacterium carotovorum subsp. carotovorum]MBA5229593.1 baseplate assembly protein [Pectobacterium aroidearum]MBA5739161.1 baseplate assembly protein [Pectobacterium aroidearum]RJL44553.1 baseplate assembly protein [Pectobacterium carotovorum]